VIVRFVHEEGTINPSADGNWTFKPLPGTTAVFQSGPKAKHFLADVKSVKIEDAGDGTDGFAKFRLVL
jgi:2',3'-cyclic-nucleotide 2'-phosphodiesterase/3'-nucleotidase